MIRFLHLADLHVEPDDAEASRVLDRLVGLLPRLRPSATILAGDLYGHAVPYVPPASARRVLEPRVCRFADAGPVFVLRGNHDHGPSLERLEDLGGAYPVRVCDRAEAFRAYTPDGPVDVYPLAYPLRAWVASLGSVEADRVDGTIAEGLEAILSEHARDIRETAASSPPAAVLGLGHYTVAGCTVGGGEVLRANEATVARSALEDVPVDYGALGHIHRIQRVADRWFYSGSPWATDFADVADKAAIVVDVGEPDDREVLGDLLAEIDGPRPVRIYALPTGARRVLTLDYRFGGVEDGAAWKDRPTDEEVAAAAGARVRLRFAVEEAFATVAPVLEEVARVERAGAESVKVERRLVTSERVREAGIDRAETNAGRFRRWRDTLAGPLTDDEARAALDFLEDLETYDDEEVAAKTEEIASSSPS